MDIPLTITPPKPHHFDMGMVECGLTKITDISIPDRFFNRMKFSNELINNLINGDGIIKGQRITIAAPRGCGKTTFLMQMLHSLHEENRFVKTGYVSNEECIEQLAYTATRINAKHVSVANMHDVDEIAELMKTLDVIVIDSVAGLSCKHHQSAFETDKYAMNTLNKASQDYDCAVIFVQHFTKNGLAKGNSGWGHAVDTCIYIYKADPEEYGEHVRVIEVQKNRFGACTEAYLSMTATGFDWDNHINASVMDDTSTVGVRELNRRRDTEAINKILESKPDGVVLSDFIDTGIDLGRVERLLKEMLVSGKVNATRGEHGNTRNTKVYTLAA